MFWFLAWLILTGKGKGIVPNFLTPGHTKNICDGKFGLAIRALRRSDAIVSPPTYMMKIIQTSGEATTCVESARVDWLLEKVPQDAVHNLSAAY